MNRKSIRWRLPASYAIIALVAALSLGSMMMLVLRNYYADQELQYLYGNAEALKPILAKFLQYDAPQASLQDQVNGLAFLSQTQIRLFDMHGKIIADSGIPGFNQVVAVSGGAPLVGNVTITKPVEKAASQTRVLIYSAGDEFPKDVIPFQQDVPLAQTADIIIPVSASPYGYGFVAKAERIPESRSSQVVSVLIISNGRKLGVLEFSNGPSYGADVIRSVTLAWLVASIFAIAIAALTGWFMSQKVTRPVGVLEKATRQMEHGNLSARVHLQNEKQQEFVSLANSFNGMAEQVEQTVSTLRAFVADAAHELHTPLTALQANLELARDEKNASTRSRYLNRVQEQAQRLEALVKSLLDLSRIEAADADAKSEFADVDLLQMVSEVGEQFASRAEQTRHEFTMDIATDGPVTVNGNETQLKQVLINLLENSLKFTPRKGSIALSLEQKENQAVITISDTGIGIPPEDLPHLFERFHRGRNSSAFPGNGLGLAIVKAIVDVHDGKVEAYSEGKDTGSTFTITLPV